MNGKQSRRIRKILNLSLYDHFSPTKRLYKKVKRIFLTIPHNEKQFFMLNLKKNLNQNEIATSN